MLLAYTTLRACLLSMTHDESSTYLNGIDQNLWLCFSSSECWGTANLHWLNTFLMQITVKLFGASEFAVRLPNVLAHLVYLLASCLLLRDMGKPFFVTFCAFLILNINPYLLEFFALARGYGMACGWMMMSLYFLWKYIQTEKTGHLLGAFSGASLAVLSSFIYLNYIVALLGVVYLLLLFPRLFDFNKKGKNRWLHAAFPLPFLAVLALLLIRPIQYLRTAGQFEYGAASLYQTLEILMRDYLQKKAYFGDWTLNIFVFVAIFLLLFAMGWAAVQLVRRQVDKRFGFMLAVLLILVGIVLMQKVQFHLLDANYLRQRTALIFVPLGLLPVVLCFLLWEYKWSKQVIIEIAIFGLIHFFLLANFKNCHEWWFEAHTKRMALHVEEQAADKTVKLGVHWIYHPTTAFYWKTGRLTAIEDLRYEREVRTDTLYDYYFVRLEDTARLHSAYVLDKRFGSNQWLYKK